MGKSAEMGIFRAFLILWKRHVASSGDHMLARDIEPDHLRAEALGERGSSLERALVVSKSASNVASRFTTNGGMSLQALCRHSL